VTCVVRDSTGYVLEIQRFKNGQKSGAWEKFNYNGQVVERNVYRRGQRVWTLYFKDDELIKSINKNGKVKTFSGCGCT
jgi:antitoxin component YwqK of YwqJK toxin-antitoxin module